MLAKATKTKVINLKPKLAKILSFEVKGDHRGSLVPIENKKDIPFDIKRVYYIYGTKDGVIRGKHAHRNLKQVVICLKGSCKFLLDDGFTKEMIELNEPSKGLYIEGLIWREMYDFSPDCLLLVLTDDFYKEEDYIRDYNEFIEIKKSMKK